MNKQLKELETKLAVKYKDLTELTRTLTNIGEAFV